MEVIGFLFCFGVFISRLITSGIDTIGFAAACVCMGLCALAAAIRDQGRK